MSVQRWKPSWAQGRMIPAGVHPVDGYVSAADHARVVAEMERAHAAALADANLRWDAEVTRALDEGEKIGRADAEQAHAAALAAERKSAGAGQALADEGRIVADNFAAGLRAAERALAPQLHSAYVGEAAIRHDEGYPCDCAGEHDDACDHYYYMWRMSMKEQIDASSGIEPGSVARHRRTGEVRTVRRVKPDGFIITDEGPDAFGGTWAIADCDFTGAAAPRTLTADENYKRGLADARAAVDAVGRWRSFPDDTLLSRAAVLAAIDALIHDGEAGR